MTREKRSIVVGTAGHVDHGKTALVEALTGKNTDRLPEEHRRGISIDLGYAPLSISKSLPMSIVDVPGHHRFVRHMVAGATGIDMYLLVVASDEGVMPQTREHLRILDLLGVESGVCVLTKRDLVDDETAELARMDVDDLVGDRAVAVVEVSSRTGLGLDRLRSTILEAAQELSPRSRSLPARLWVDRAFTLHGPGTIATGTLWSGSVASGQRLVALPGDLEVRVRSVQVHDEEVAAAEGGRRVGLALTGASPRSLDRGVVLCEPGAFPTSYRLDVALSEAEAKSERTWVRLHHGTGEQTARLIRLEDRYGQLRLTQPVSAFRGDRMILRWDGETLGGATVVDPSPPRLLDAERVRRYERGSPEEIVEALLTEAGRPVGRELLLNRGILTPGEADQGLAAAHQLGTEFVTRRWFEETSAQVQADVERHAHEHPLDPGLPIESIGAAGRWRDAFLAALPLERRGAKLYQPGSGPRVQEYEPLVERVRLAVRESGSTPVALSGLTDLAPEEQRALAEILEERGDIVRVRGDLVMDPIAYRSAEDRLIEACNAEEAGVSLGAYRDLLGSSRRTAEALLQHFDATGLTLRVGDNRILRRRSQRDGG
jgi:selenocysteine-specific elongation factor